MISFTKMHAVGNDFVVLDVLRDSIAPEFDFPKFAQWSCNRHFGIGGDGLLLLCEADEDAKRRGVAARMRMWNPDGSEDMCGNGLRCVAHLANRRGHIVGRKFEMQTLAGLRQVEILDDGQIRAGMGAPRWELPQIPMQPPHGFKSERDNRAIEYALKVGDEIVSHATTLSTGSTHTIIFVDENPFDAGFDEKFFRLSPQIEHHAWFPERTSVLWAHVWGPHDVQVRIWERGVGETLACGTGACAVGVAAQMTSRCTGAVDVRSRGGVLRVDWRGEESEIQLTGPARVVYEGAASSFEF